MCEGYSETLQDHEVRIHELEKKMKSLEEALTEHELNSGHEPDDY